MQVNRLTEPPHGYLPGQNFDQKYFDGLRSGKSCKSIALVEDDQDAQLILEHIVGHAGFEVTTFEEGISAFRFFTALSNDEDQPDCFLIDLMLPNFNGFELARALRVKGFKGTIIGVTATERSLLHKIGKDTGQFTTILHKSEVIEQLPEYLSIV